MYRSFLGILLSMTLLSPLYAAGMMGGHVQIMPNAIVATPQQRNMPPAPMQQARPGMMARPMQAANPHFVRSNAMINAHHHGFFNQFVSSFITSGAFLYYYAYYPYYSYYTPQTYSYSTGNDSTDPYPSTYPYPSDYPYSNNYPGGDVYGNEAASASKEQLWVPADRGYVPSHAQPYNDEDGRTVYRCRSEFKGTVYYGKLIPNEGCYAQDTDTSVNLRFDNYEVLLRAPTS